MSHKQRKAKFQEVCGRKDVQHSMALFMFVIMAAGLYCPRFHFVMVGLSTALIIFYSSKGRFYCGWLCPMGAFHERFLAKISRNNPIPEIFMTSWFRWFVFTAMMIFMSVNLWLAWGDTKAVGTVFRTMWIISMVLAVGLGIFYKARIWCTICHMGTLQGAFSRDTYLLRIDDTCINCKLCRRVCPVATYPGAYTRDFGSAFVPSMECLRCFNCVQNCPKDSLSFATVPPTLRKLW